jgi:hypothetical protein
MSVTTVKAYDFSSIKGAAETIFRGPNENTGTFWGILIFIVDFIIIPIGPLVLLTFGFLTKRKAKDQPIS